jgi:CubicO group peptidase (beta-lactamase class C family)
MRRLLALAAGLVAAVPAHGQSGQFDLNKTKTVLTGLINKAIAENGVPSIQIALVKGDSVVWTAAFGFSNVRMKVPATTETYYSTGSTFKAATATAIMQLVEQGKLKLDDPVNRYLGDERVQDQLQVEKPVTFRHILTHRSGLLAGANTEPIWGRKLPKTLDKMVSGLYSVRPPEQKYEYNNYAYGMAGLLIEKISTVEYEKYMYENVLKPLGIKTEHFVRPTPEMVELMALPYNASAGKPPTPVEQVHFDVYPAGDIWLRAEEMARFLGAHLNGGMWQGKRIISEASVKTAHEAPYGGNYAFGWGVRKDSKNGHTIIAHTGGIPGMSSNMVGDVDAKVGVYYMSNSGAPGSIADAAIALLRGEDWAPPADRKTIALDAKALDRYVGSYQLNPDLSIVVAREASGLVFRANGQGDATALLAESATRFFVKGQTFTIEFVSNAAGEVEKLVIEDDGEKQEAKKQK